MGGQGELKGKPAGIRRSARRRMALLLAAALVGAHQAAGAFHEAPPPPADSGPPNVLIIMMDDQRAEGTLDVMPNTRYWFADGGTSFTRAFANTPLCCPARSTAFSGRYQHNHGVVTNRDGDRLDQSATFQRYLYEAGYHTAMAGKFLLHWRGPVPYFDHYAQTNGGYVDSSFEVGDADGHDLGPRPSRADYSTDYINDRALEYLDHFEEDDARPWLLYLAPQAPHGDFTPAPRHADAPVPDWQPSLGVTDDYTASQKADKVPFMRHYRYPVEQADTVRRQQLRTLLSVDDMVANVFARLEAQGELDNTLAVFTSDNGAFWAEHGMRSKSLPYRESVEVPFMVRWPGRVPAGDVDDRLVGLVDIAPTVLVASRLTPETPTHVMDGRPFLDDLGLTAERRNEILLEWAVDPGFGYLEWASLRSPDWQYVEYYESDGQTVSFREHYDLVADPYQLENVLADADPANDPDVRALSARLAGARQCAGTNAAAPGAPNACP